MRKRIVSTIVLWGILIGGLLWWGPEAAVWLVAAITVLTQYELYRIIERMGHRPFRTLGLCLGALMILGPHYAQKWPAFGDRFAAESVIIAAIITICCVRILFEREQTDRFATLSTTLFGLLFAPFMLQFLIKVFWLYPDPWHGLMAAVWIVAVAKFCDTGALLVGSAIGRHKMAPSISPRKTWEGVAGGIVCSMLASALIVWLFPHLLPPQLTLPLAVALAVPIAIAAIIADLIESLLKRAAELKDSGRSIPGIGGAFDLTDSLVLAAPLGYGLLLIFAA